MKLADTFISSMCKNISVDIFTGTGDSGSLHVPTAAFHPLLFPNVRISTKFSKKKYKNYLDLKI